MHSRFADAAFGASARARVKGRHVRDAHESAHATTTGYKRAKNSRRTSLFARRVSGSTRALSALSFYDLGNCI